MKLLLDTHTLIWWTAGNERLPESARAAIAGRDSVVYVSAASAWEITTKFRLGKLPEAKELAKDVERNVALDGFAGLPISMRHAEAAGRLRGSHNDPFDRMLIAQALVEGLTLVSDETAFDGYGVSRLW